MLSYMTTPVKGGIVLRLIGKASFRLNVMAGFQLSPVTFEVLVVYYFGEAEVPYICATLVTMRIESSR